MYKTFFAFSFCLALQFTYAQSVNDNKQQFASLGDFVLESGEKIIDCKIGYRTFGKLNADKKNVVICLPGAGGRSFDEQQWVPGNIVDTTKFYLIIFDTFGNGVSSSPSNSSKQSRARFPVFTITDLVRSQHKVLTEKMNINHLVAVLGFSMGGIQSFQWSVTYPDFMDKIMPFMGTPKMSAYDLLWITMIFELIKDDPEYKDGNYAVNPPIVKAAHLFPMISNTPEYFNNNIALDTFNVWLKSIEKQIPPDWNDFVWQITACRMHDIGAKFGNSLDNAAKAIKAKAYIIVNKQDHTVNPIAAIKFASKVNAKLFVIDDEEGHVALSKLPYPSMREFLAE